MRYFRNDECSSEIGGGLIFYVKHENPPFQSSKKFRSAARLRLALAPTALAPHLYTYRL